jgi:hypothetical protein
MVGHFRANAQDLSDLYDIHGTDIRFYLGDAIIIRHHYLMLPGPIYPEPGFFLYFFDLIFALCPGRRPGPRRWTMQTDASNKNQKSKTNLSPMIRYGLGVPGKKRVLKGCPNRVYGTA